MTTARDSHADHQITSWDRVREALRRDWEQTKHDVGIPGGHQLNQEVNDTVEQALGKKAIPNDDRPNPAKVIGSWDEAEVPVGYGYNARQRFLAQYPQWNNELEGRIRNDWEAQVDPRLRAEWDARKESRDRQWDGVKSWIRYGYEYEPKH